MGGPLHPPVVSPEASAGTGSGQAAQDRAVCAPLDTTLKVSIPGLQSTSTPSKSAKCCECLRQQALLAQCQQAAPQVAPSPGPQEPSVAPVYEGWSAGDNSPSAQIHPDALKDHLEVEALLHQRYGHVLPDPAPQAPTLRGLAHVPSTQTTSEAPFREYPEWILGSRKSGEVNPCSQPAVPQTGWLSKAAYTQCAPYRVPGDLLVRGFGRHNLSPVKLHGHDTWTITSRRGELESICRDREEAFFRFREKAVGLTTTEYALELLDSALKTEDWEAVHRAHQL